MKPSGRTRMAPPLGTPASAASRCALAASIIETSPSGNPNGKEIVFIHGFMQSHLSWSKQVRDPELARQFRMISYDFRGHGGSDKILDPKLYDNGEAYAEELNAVIQTMSLNRPVLVGWSYGTRIISDYLDRYGSAKLAGINFVGGIGNGDAKYFGPVMPLIPKTSTEDLYQLPLIRTRAPIGADQWT